MPELTLTTSAGPVTANYTERGSGPAVLLIHGGAGPQSMTGFADLLAERHSVRVLTPVHPGFGGTARPEELTSTGQLAELYLNLLDALDLHDVTVVGNSLGGWIAAELALTQSDRVAALVLIGAVGIEVPDHPPVDFFNLTLPEVFERSFFDPTNFAVDPAAMPPEQAAVMAAGRAALAVYGGTTMTDPGLRARLSAITLPTLVVWGEADGIVDSEYGRAYAAAIPGAEFTLLPETGHLPQLETPDQLLPVISDFVQASARLS
jgi:pimeloyl-ACP methyl ester carboxylesterase